MDTIEDPTHAPSRLRFSAGTLQNHPLPQLLERWRYLDALGFDTLWLTDHFANP
jgi:alkanesulfonate monooxygenase SsuD/methylene tetrahydromethanopterin reductase-like flavin-dependent oxidoreductase (luciferase family)